MVLVLVRYSRCDKNVDVMHQHNSQQRRPHPAESQLFNIDDIMMNTFVVKDALWFFCIKLGFRCNCLAVGCCATVGCCHHRIQVFSSLLRSLFVFVKLHVWLKVWGETLHACKFAQNRNTVGQSRPLCSSVCVDIWDAFTDSFRAQIILVQRCCSFVSFLSLSFFPLFCFFIVVFIRWPFHSLDAAWARRVDVCLCSLAFTVQSVVIISSLLHSVVVICNIWTWNMWIVNARICKCTEAETNEYTTTTMLFSTRQHDVGCDNLMEISCWISWDSVQHHVHHVQWPYGVGGVEERGCNCTISYASQATFWCWINFPFRTLWHSEKPKNGSVPTSTLFRKMVRVLHIQK